MITNEIKYNMHGSLTYKNMVSKSVKLCIYLFLFQMSIVEIKVQESNQACMIKHIMQKMERYSIKGK